MKRKDFEIFAMKYLDPHLPGFVAKGHLIYRVPVNAVFSGFIFDSSGFSADSFNPSAFVQPLYVPSEHFTMTLGQRLLGVWKFRSDDQGLADALLRSIKKEGLPLLDALGTPEKLARDAETLKNSSNHYVRQAAAYSLVWIGRDQDAVRRLDELLAILLEMSSSRKWALAVRTEVAGLREMLSKDPQGARALLNRWAEETRIKLGLPE